MSGKDVTKSLATDFKELLNHFKSFFTNYKYNKKRILDCYKRTSK